MLLQFLSSRFAREEEEDSMRVMCGSNSLFLISCSLVLASSLLLPFLLKPFTASRISFFILFLCFSLYSALSSPSNPVSSSSSTSIFFESVLPFLQFTPLFSPPFHAKYFLSQILEKELNTQRVYSVSLFLPPVYCF